MTKDFFEHLMGRLTTEDRRYRFHFGNVETGRDRLDVWGCDGYVRRTVGGTNFLIVHNARSTGGQLVSHGSIVRIRPARWNGQDGLQVRYDTYCHPAYHTGFTGIVHERVSRKYPWAAQFFGETIARFETEKGARRWIRKNQFDYDRRDYLIASTLEGL